MKKQKDSKRELIKGIEKDAREEAQRIVAEAFKQAEVRRQAVQVQVAAILEQARNKAQAQMDTITRLNRSNITVETRRIRLKQREEIIKHMIQKVEDKLSELIEQAQYAQVLVNWIVEAAIGLNVDEAVVNVSKQEKQVINQEILNKAAKKLQSLIHKKVKLSLDNQAPLVAQGVVLYTKDKKMAFNNQVPTRLLRYQSEVRKLIFDELFQYGVQGKDEV